MAIRLASVASVGVGSCAMCSTTAGPGLDLGIEFNIAVEVARVGAVVICDKCFQYLAETLMGYVPEVERDAQLAEHEKLAASATVKVGEIKDDLVSIVDLINTVTDLGYSATYLEKPEEAAKDGHDKVAGQSDGTSSEQDATGVPSDPSDESDTLELFGTL